MKKLLLAEVAVLLVLVVVAVFVRVGIFRVPEPELDVPDQSQSTSAPTDADTQTQPPTQPPTDPPTEPPSDAPVISTAPPTEPTLPPTEPEGPGIPAEGVTLSAKRYFVYDVERDRFLAISGSENNPVYPASITKLFSAYVALQYLDPETVITAGDELDLVRPGSSLAYIKKGHRLRVDMLVEGMLLPSGNDAAYILAAAAARAASGNPNMRAQAAIDYFVKMMNTTAVSMGMTGSHFRNPDGYHEIDHYTSCHDLTIIAKLALSSDVIMRYAGTVRDDVRFESGETIEWNNTNQLIDRSSNYYCDNAIGLKTGTTDAAGNCLLSAFQEKDGLYIIGVFGCKERADRFKDTRKLYWTLVCDD